MDTYISIGTQTAVPWVTVWTPFFSSIGVLVVGFIAASIAYRQWRTAQVKLRLDLYDKRLAIYRSCTLAITCISVRGRLSIAELEDLAAHSGEAEFLFDREVKIYMTELHRQHGFAAYFSDKDLPPITVADVFRSGERGSDWAESERLKIQALFGPYMQLEGRRPGRSKIELLPHHFPIPFYELDKQNQTAADAL